MTAYDSRVLDSMQSQGLLDGRSRAFAIDLLQQGCTLEQVLLGSRLVSEAEFIDILSSLGLLPEGHLYNHQAKAATPKLRSLNTEIERVLRTAIDKCVYEVVFVPTHTSVRVIFGESTEFAELPKALYPALVMRLRRWGARLGWEVKRFATHTHDGIRLVRTMKRATEHPAEKSEALTRLKEGGAGLYIFVRPDAYLTEHYFNKPIEGATIITSIDDESIEDALHEALFGGIVLVTAPQAKPAWWQPLEDAGVPVHLLA